MTKMTYKRLAILLSVLVVGIITIVVEAENVEAIAYKTFTSSTTDASYNWKYGAKSSVTTSASQGNMKLYARGPMGNETHLPQVGAILKKSVPLTANQAVLVEVSGTSECDWVNRARVDTTHCFMSAHIQQPDTRPGTIPEWCNVSPAEGKKYGTYSNSTVLRENQEAFWTSTTCTPPTTGNYDVVLYGHVVAGHSNGDYVKLDIRGANYNITTPNRG